MNQKYLELANKKITLVEKNRFNTSKDFDVTAISDLCVNLEDFDPSNIEENINNNPMNISNLLNQELNSWIYNLDNKPLLKILLDNDQNYQLLIPQLNIIVNV